MQFCKTIFLIWYVSSANNVTVLQVAFNAWARDQAKSCTSKSILLAAVPGRITGRTTKEYVLYGKHILHWDAVVSHCKCKSTPCMFSSLVSGRYPQQHPSFQIVLKRAKNIKMYPCASFCPIFRQMRSVVLAAHIYVLMEPYLWELFHDIFLCSTIHEEQQHM